MTHHEREARKLEKRAIKLARKVAQKPVEKR